MTQLVLLGYGEPVSLHRWAGKPSGVGAGIKKIHTPTQQGSPLSKPENSLLPLSLGSSISIAKHARPSFHLSPRASVRTCSGPARLASPGRLPQRAQHAWCTCGTPAAQELVVRTPAAAPAQLAPLSLLKDQIEFLLKIHKSWLILKANDPQR